MLKCLPFIFQVAYLPLEHFSDTALTRSKVVQGPQLSLSLSEAHYVTLCKAVIFTRNCHFLQISPGATLTLQCAEIEAVMTSSVFVMKA